MDAQSILLELKPVADPQSRHGYPARSPDYRLKLLLKALLRAYGFRCVAVRVGTGEAVAVLADEPVVSG